MDPLHKTLSRQIERYLGKDFVASPEQLKLFQAISQAYQHFDEDRALTERSFEISSQELAQINRNIEKEVENRTRELRLEHARFIASANSLNAGLIICDGAGVAIVLNRVARNILAYTPPTLKASALPEKDIIWTTQTMNQRFGGAFDLEADMKVVIASRKPVEHKAIQYGDRVLRIFIAPVMDQHTQEEPERLGSIIFIEDVTEAKILERSRDEFFSIASHELRTPLTAIKGNTSMMLTYFPDVFQNEQLREMANDIHESSTRLIEIVNDFLDVSRLEQGKMSFNLKPFSIQQLIEKVIYEVKALSTNKNVEVTFDPMELNVLPLVLADPDRTKQVIYNLIGNAIKFTEQGRIKVIAGRDDQHFIKVWVSDTGRGIPLETQGILFHKFQQAGTSLLTRDTTRGTGLGLYISKLIMERMGGTIKLEQSTEGKGSIFSISLPIATVDPRVSNSPGPIAGE